MSTPAGPLPGESQPVSAGPAGDYGDGSMDSRDQPGPETAGTAGAGEDAGPETAGIAGTGEDAGPETAGIAGTGEDAGPETAGTAGAGEDAGPADPGPGASALEEDDRHGIATRWKAIQADFVDEPRRAVAEADALVTELMQRLAATFAREHAELEQRWAGGAEVSTEDLRQSLRRYRSFFERLLEA